MVHDTKKEIAKKLREKIDELKITQNEASRRIGISASNTSIILTNSWFNKPTTSPSDEIWRKVQFWVKGNAEDWNIAITPDYTRLFNICKHAQERSLSKCISFQEGSGKSENLKAYANQHNNVYYIECEPFWSKRAFIQKLALGMGLNTGYKNITNMIDDIIDFLNQRERPLVILDEFDQLLNSAMILFKTLYNKCLSAGFVLAGGLYLEDRIMNGVRGNKQAFREMYSRFGREFLKMYGANKETIRQICVANGVTQEALIKSVIEDSKGDLRRVKDKIHTIRYKKEVKK